MIKLDHSGWARKLLQRSVRTRRAGIRRNSSGSYATESLEDRSLLTPLIIDGSADVGENTPDGTIVFDVNDENTGADVDEDNDPLTYSILSGNDLGAFAINAASGEISVADFTQLDHETTPVISLVVQATDSIEAPSNATITLNITDLLEDISIDDAFLVDGNGNRITSPLIGEMIGVRVDYITSNLGDPINYSIGYELDGVPIATEGLDNGEGSFNMGAELWTDTVEGWYATAGTHTLVITVDSDNTVGEDNENNNEFTIVFSTSTASPPVQFGWPLEGEPQTDYYITAYVDVDPTTDDNTRDDEADYAGGFHTVDQTTGWHISPPTFHDQDLQIPVYAAADGVVSAVNDGEFDRNTQVLDPLPDPIPDSNFITIDHGDGYATTYSRLRQNSVWLRPGDPVVQGQLIGLVGSSGPFAVEPALHWEVSRHGRPIETLIDPNVYLQSEPDYSGSFSFVRRSFFTQCLPTHPFQPCPNPTTPENPIPYNFTAHLLEGPSSVPSFPASTGQRVAVFFEVGTIRTGDAIEAVWRRPDGTEFATDQANANREDYSAEFWFEHILDPEPLVGTWTVEFFQNGAKIGEDSFELISGELPEMRVERQSLIWPARLDITEEIYVDERYTPVDLGMPGGGEFGGTTDETWTIHNQGAGDLIIDEILLPDAFQFDLFNKLGGLIRNFPGAASYAGGNSDLVIEGGTASYILVQPVPGLAPGYYSGMVRMFSNDADEQDYNISVEARVPTLGGIPSLEIGVASRDIYEDPVSGDLRTRLVANVRRLNDNATSIEDEVVVDLIAEVSDVTFPGNVRIPPNEDYASFYIETFDDNKIEGFEYLRIGAQDRDNFYTPAFTTIRIIDDDIAAVTVVETDGGTVVDENGSTDTFSLTLDAEPITNVVLDVFTDDPGEATASPARLTYTPLNWNVPQTVTVTGVNDDATDGDIDSNVVISVFDFLSDNDFDSMEDVLVPITTIDNDIPGFLITETDGDTVVSETGAVDTFSIRLTRAPQANVIFDLSVADLGEASVNVGSLIFTPANWNIDQAVTVSGIDDNAVDGDISSSITAAVRDIGSDPDWASVPDQTVAVTTTDDEVAGFTITAVGPLIVSETGTSATFDVALTDLPLSDVRLQLVPTDPTEVAVSPSTLRFRPSNGTTPQTVTVTGLDDTFVDMDIDSMIIVSVIDQQSNNFFDGLPNQQVDVTTVDDDLAGVAVVQTGAGTEVTEAGATDSFDLVLNAEPQSDVVVDVTSSDTTEFTVDIARVTFTPTNWSTPVTITVTGEDDTEVDGDITDTVTFTINDALSDPEYHGLAITPLDVLNVDDEIAEIIVVESDGATSVSETGTSDTFDVTLTGPPLSPVVVEILSNDLTEVSFTPATLTFTGANYNVPQTVTVTGEDDDVVDGPITSQMSVRVIDAESHPAFHPSAEQLVTLVTTDDEASGIEISLTGGSTVVSESGTTDTFDVVLTGEPLVNVVLDVAHSDIGEGVVSPARLTFTPGDWDQPQTVTVTGVDDVFADGDIVANVVVSVDDSASAGRFAAVPDENVSVTTTDDDVADFIVTETGVHTLTREGGNTDNVEVVLTAAPTSSVVIDVVSTDNAEVAATPAAVTFDSSNWNVPQVVTFNAVDDGSQDGKKSTVANFAVAAGSNGMFLGLTDSISVITIDNDSSIYLDDTQLIVDATILDDVITLEETGITISVTLNSQTLPFTTDQYDSIFIQAKPGNDIVTATSVTAPVRVLGGGGNDLIETGSGADTVRGGGGLDTIIGNDGPDLLSGGNKRDWIEGGRGLDSMQGGRGADSLVGGDGSDSIQGQNGRDTIVGGAGSDTLSGNNGPDSILGDSGADFISGGGGDDIVSAGSGMDTILGGSGKDLLNGEEDGDLIIGGSANDTVNGNDGRDVLFGGTDLDIVNGHDGEDILGAGRVNLSSAEMGSILDEWNSARTYQQRVDNIHDGPTKTNDRLNTAFLIGPNRPPSPQTAFDDEDRDELTGAGGNDFFFANVDNRDELDNALTEWVDLI